MKNIDDLSEPLATLCKSVELDGGVTLQKAEDHFRGMDDGQLANALSNAHQAIVTGHRRGLVTTQEERKFVLQDYIGAVKAIREFNNRQREKNSDRVPVKPFSVTTVDDVFPGNGGVPGALESALRSAVALAGGTLEEYPFGPPDRPLCDFIRHAKETPPYDGVASNSGSVLEYDGGMSKAALDEAKKYNMSLKVSS